LFKCYP